MFRYLLGFSISLYLISLITTMAGMEAFGWLTFAIVLGGLAYNKVTSSNPLPTLGLHSIGTDWIVGALFLVVVLGVYINGAPGIDATESIGSMRWILLMYAFLAALIYFQKIPVSYFYLFMTVSGIVAINSLVMYLTGFNPARNEPVIYHATESVFRGSGFFSIPTTYGHSAAMICALGFAALVTKFKPFKGALWFFIIITTLVLLSVITSYTRASYISLAAAIMVMAFMSSRKLFFQAAIGGVIIGAVFFATNEGFRHRFVSIFDMQYASNSQRLELWRAHFEMFKDYPVLGMGLHDNERRNPEYNIKLGQEGAFTGNAHNNYLQFLAGTGILGFGLYMIFIGYYLWLNYRLWKNKDEYNPFGQTLILGIMGAQVSFHIAGLMDSNFKDAEVKHLFLFMVVVLIALSKGLETKTLSPRAQN